MHGVLSWTVPYMKAGNEHAGHLGASLGVVELTVALHYVFNTPDDKVILPVASSGPCSESHELYWC